MFRESELKFTTHVLKAGGTFVVVLDFRPAIQHIHQPRVRLPKRQTVNLNDNPDRTIRINIKQIAKLKTVEQRRRNKTYCVGEVASLAVEVGAHLGGQNVRVDFVLQRPNDLRRSL